MITKTRLIAIGIAIIFGLGYLAGSHNKQEVLDGLIHIIMVCNVRK